MNGYLKKEKKHVLIILRHPVYGVPHKFVKIYKNIIKIEEICKIKYSLWEMYLNIKRFIKKFKDVNVCTV